MGTESFSYKEGEAEVTELVLPFDTKKNPIQIMQGWGGPWSHKEGVPNPRSSLLYAVDFALPYGTIVKAARSGIFMVIQMKSESYYDGPDPYPPLEIQGKPNIVCIVSGEGEIDIYSHLEKYSALLSNGETAEEGQPIARTGKSGWVGTVPHLHFHTQAASSQQSIPIAFKDYPHSLWHKDI